MTTLRWGSASDVGMVRTNNEDTALVEEPLFAVADGMGGHAAGEVASSVAIAAFRAAAGDGLTGAVQAANQAVLDRADGDQALRGMGTTLCALTLHTDDGQDQIEIVNVGDSRGYLLRDGDLSQVTDDHNVPAELVREGRLSRAEAKVHPQKNIVTRVLGNSPDVEVDRFAIDPYRGDRFLLCSDGLFDEIDDDVIAEVLRRRADAQEAATELVERAKQAGGRDNITVVVVDVIDDGGKAAAASSRLETSGVGRAEATVVVQASDTGPRPAAAPAAAALRRRRLTWRSAAFTFGVLLVLAGTVGSVWWFGRGTYFVGIDQGEVTIFKGRPGGLLWLDPTVERRTDITLAEVPDANKAALQEGKTEPSRAAAEAYVRRLGATATPATTSSTTTTTATSTSTTVAVTTTPSTAAPG